MDSIRQYILTVFSAAIITSIAVRFTANQRTVSKIIKLICSVFLLVTITSPLLKFKMPDITGYMDSFDLDASNIIDDAKSCVEQETVKIIIAQSQAYIEDKAADYGAKITAVVSATDPNTLVPDAITISGNVSPYTKYLLQHIIYEYLGIQEDKQTWN